MPATRLGLGLAAVVLLLPSRDCGEGTGPRSAPAPPPTAAVAASPASPVPAAEPPPDVFTASVRPVLLNRCAPCHEPGGQMYARLPFDDAGIVAAHPEGVLKRLKDADRQAVEKWLATLPEKTKG